jgi:hypothetical protein
MGVGLPEAPSSSSTMRVRLDILCGSKAVRVGNARGFETTEYSAVTHVKKHS